MHKPESVLQNETYTFLLDFEKDLIQARRPNLVIFNKKEKKKKKEKRGTCRITDFAIPEDQRVKIKENEKRDK